MIRTLIVDDESIVRATLRSLIDWEGLGYEVAGDCVSAAQALAFVQTQRVDLLLTDMKMPGMSGLVLLEQLREGAHMPVTVVLSGYNEFELVREAFRLGAYDYLLKADLNEASLTALLRTLREKIFSDTQPAAQRGAARAAAAAPLAPGDYTAVTFAVDDFEQAAVRFGGDLREALEKPMLELARQIPRLSGRATLRAVHPSRYEMCWQVRDASQLQATVTSVVRQVQSVWRDYMNISVSAAVSAPLPAADVAQAFAQCDALLRLCVLQGPGALCTQWKHSALAQLCGQTPAACDALVTAVCAGESMDAEREKALWFRHCEALPDAQRRDACRVLVVRMAQRLRECGQTLHTQLADGQSIEAALCALQSAKEHELWTRGFLRGVQTYLAGQQRKQQPDTLQKARLFVEDNYTNPDLTLKTVADYAGFNEKYFSARFTKEFGCTFIAFLNRLRVHRAEELLTQTSMKMYEISDYVGYNNVEHFNHTFKKQFGVSPGDYRARAHTQSS